MSNYILDSFDIGENTLRELEKQSNIIRTPLSSKKQENYSDDDEIIEESPNAKEKFCSLSHLPLHEQLKHATQRGKQRRHLERTRSVIKNPNQSRREISSISRILKDEGNLDFSAWEKSAAKLVSPGVFTIKSDPPKETFLNAEPVCLSQDVFTEDPLDIAITADLPLHVPTDFDDDGINWDNVSFMQSPVPVNDKDAESLVEDQMQKQKSIMIASQSFQTESVIVSQNISVKRPQHNRSLTLDMSKNLRLLSSWNLPQSVVNEYRKKNIVEMYEWQLECLTIPRVIFELSNLVYSAPTSGGKTLIGEVLMIKSIVELKKKALFILPFVSVVREKMLYLQDLLTSSGIRVEGFFGGYHPPGGFESIDLAVCTIEKANSIVNRLLEQDRLSDIGIIVIDEIHLISDPNRGYILELLLTKILYMREKFNLDIQIVTMSATLPNVDLLTKWLRAEFYQTDYRPIELREMIKIGKNIFDSDMKLLRVANEQLKEFFPDDTDEVCGLAMETILDNCQLIIFCPTKTWCEKLCRKLAEGIYNMVKAKHKAIEDVFDKKRLVNLLEQIKALPSGVDKPLLDSLNYGCAFHHAGLTTDERDIVEMGFKEGTLKVLVATSTLASGVNLPARRVIIRTPMFGKAMMSNLTYRQMIGRAGRKGQDILGESILVCDSITAKTGKQLINTPLDPVSSCLHNNNHEHLKRAILEIIASGVAKTKTDLENFINSTLFCQQHNITFTYFNEEDESKFKELINKKTTTKTAMPSKEVKDKDKSQDPVKSAMDFLLDFEFIRVHLEEESNEIQFVPTRLGLACLSSSMPPRDGFFLFSELQKAQQSFVLASELHSIYLVTPFSVASQLNELDWTHFDDLFDELPASMKKVGEIVGVSKAFILKGIRLRKGNDAKAVETEAIHKRFFTALALQDLVNEKSIDEVSKKFGIHRGVLQNLQQMSSLFAGTVTTFCKSLEFKQLAGILSEFRERLFFGIHPDLIDLMKIPSMSTTRIARALHKTGITKLSDLANCKALTVENVLMNLGSNFFVSGKSMEMNIQEVAKLLIKEARSHIQMEMGLIRVDWSQDEEKGNQSLKLQVSILEAAEARSTSGDKRQVNELVEKIAKKRSNESMIKTIEDEVRNQNSAKKMKPTETNSFKKPQIANKLANDQLSKSAKEESADQNASLFLLNETAEESIEKYLEIIDVLANDEAFNLFKAEISEQTNIAMSLGIEKFKIPTQLIGGNLRKPKRESQFDFSYGKNSLINCISFSYSSKKICLMSLQTASNSMTIKVKKFLSELMSRQDLTLTVYEAREQLKILSRALNTKLEFNVTIQDPRISSWLTNADINLKWSEMVTEYIPDHLNILKLVTKGDVVSSLGLNHESHIEPKKRTAVESFLSKNLIIKLIEKLKSTGNGIKSLQNFCDKLEMPIQKCLINMEMCGFPVNEKKLRKQIEDSAEIQRELEKYIYLLNDRKTFDISSSQEVKIALGIPKFDGKTKKKTSTAKNVLEKINTPLSKSIMTWRTLDTTISNLVPMTKIVSGSRFYGSSFSLNQTGRISFKDPNLQNVTKDFDVNLKDRTENISFRSVFECSEGKVLMSADFCQLEFRILAHLCNDTSLIKIMNSEGEDIFRKIAAKWNKIEETAVTTEIRNQTKELCYAIIYGMGNSALAEKLNVDEDTSATITADFHATYPKFKEYNAKIIKRAREQEFVETMTGRRRYIPLLKSEDSKLRSKAERKVLNTCVQGTASDLVKNAMFRMERNVKKKNFEHCQLVLHLHDELIYEVSKSELIEAAKTLKRSMENCIKLNVPLLVKLKSGPNWGQMKDLDLVVVEPGK